MSLLGVNIVDAQYYKLICHLADANSVLKEFLDINL